MKNNKFNTLVEDTMQSSQNFLGTDNRELKPRKVSIVDLITQYNKLNQDMEKAPNILPAPLNNGIVDHIGDTVTSLESVRMALAEVVENPLIRDNEDSREVVGNMLDKIELIKKGIVSLADDLDDLAVAK